MESESEIWFKKAKSDFEHAKKSLEMHDFDWAQLASQQCAEKALKAVCIKKGFGLIKIHDLVILAKKVGSSIEILSDASILNSFYSSSRYPDVSPNINDEEIKGYAME